MCVAMPAPIQISYYKMMNNYNHQRSRIENRLISQASTPTDRPPRANKTMTKIPIGIR